MTTSILILNGPNLNLLGTREPDIYGNQTLADIESLLQKEANELDIVIDFIQSNAEHILVEKIHTAKSTGVKFIIVNPAALTHTSIALRDALLGVGIPFIEVHLSNIFSRESFRHHSYLSDIAQGVITGLGVEGYLFALRKASLLIK